MTTIENFATGAQRLGAGDRNTAKFGPGFGAIERLSEIVLQLQRAFPRGSRSGQLGVFSDQRAARAFCTRLAIDTCSLLAICPALFRRSLLVTA